MANDARPDKLQALHDRLAAEQRRLILQAAEADTIPPAGLIGRIAQLEGAIVATEAAIEEAVSSDAL